MIKPKNIFGIFGAITVVCIYIIACTKDTPTETPYVTTPYSPPVISGFRPMPQDSSNPMTLEGIALGEKLFFDPILSKNNTISCSSCHKKENAFSDPHQFSLGVNDSVGKRNALALINLAWYPNNFFWDGRAHSLNEQAVFPVEDTKEMNLSWTDAVSRLQNNATYTDMFKKAFNTKTITRDWVTKALTQYEKTLLSYNAPIDKYFRGEAPLDTFVLRGMQVFNSERGDCFHCHTTKELFVHPTRFFVNNGMDLAPTGTEFADLGLGVVTHNPADNGKFKLPTLRNLAFTAPYMHDGRFNTLDEVIESYNRGPQNSPTVEPILIEKANIRLTNTGVWGLQLSPHEKYCLKQFLLALSDSSFVN